MSRPGQRRSAKIIFITGTDTGVGKTLLAGLLVHHLRASGCHALALKPFCSGSRADAKFLRAAQDGELTLDEINPFSFAEPLAPLVAARMHRRVIRLSQVLKRIRQIAARCEVLFVEGAGGLLAPLGENFSALDMISRLNCDVIVVARNRLGTINHTLLTIQALKDRAKKQPRVVLMGCQPKDFSARTNGPILAELGSPSQVVAVKDLGRRASQPAALKKSAKKIKNVLARLCR